VSTRSIEDVLNALGRAGVSKHQALRAELTSPAPRTPSAMNGQGPPTFAGVYEILESMASTYVRYAQRCRELADSLRERDPLLQQPRIVIPTPEPVLTRRQIQVRDRLCDGFNVPEIAKQLTRSVATVRTYVQGVYKAYGVHSQIELVRIERARRSAAEAKEKGNAL
jgi:DNA-binding CsgD family transcriptional regulator